MVVFSLLYRLIIGPLEFMFDTLYTLMLRLTDVNYGVSIVGLSLTINFLVLPLYMRADAMQEEERVRTESLKKGVEHIRKTFKGDERFMILQTYYRQNDYKPYYALKGSMSLLLEIPFFIAAYNFLSGLNLFDGVSFGPIRDLGSPDGMFSVGGHAVNVLPLLMTFINIVSGYIYAKGMPLKSKLQLYGMALIFLVFLYSSPAGLVFYWTLNNLFSLVKNIFYKIKNPKFVLSLISAAIGVCTLAYLVTHPIIDQYKHMLLMRKNVFVLAVSIFLMLPLAIWFYTKKHPVSVKRTETTKEDRVIFLFCAVLMTLVTGVLIPSAVIASSPLEFIDLMDFHSPLRYVLQAFLLSAGTFLLWLGVFYYLFSAFARRLLSFGLMIFSGAALTDYLFFGKDYGNMSPMLQYDEFLDALGQEGVINAVVLVTLAAVLLLIRKKWPFVIKTVSAAACAAIFIMSCLNIVSIQSGFNQTKKTISEGTFDSTVSFPLDKSGKNVVVIMLDRAITEFFPYIIQEKPELEKQFAGFTYYPNTISYGNYTIVGTSGLYGGYEYTPAESDKRDLSVKEKRNESLKMMPYLFDDNGYKVTVFDPPYAGMQLIPNLRIYSERPSIRCFITKNRVAEGYDPEANKKILYRNFFAYSLFRTSPVCMHFVTYNKGRYNHSSNTDSMQVIEDSYHANGGFDGGNPYFIGTYSVLSNFSDMTDITDTGRNTFMVIDNETAHNVVMLQEPAYEPSNDIDNSPYEENPPVRYAADGSKIVFRTSYQMMHYQCNMAAMIKLGQWLDYLRENGVYDNTRIIIVSDHGRFLSYLNGMKIDDQTGSGNAYDVMAFKALLMVKDFGSTELKSDETFMTNADTPSLAFEGLIEHPVNPFTGKEITTDGKNVSEHCIAYTYMWSPEDYKGDEKKYLGITWIGFKGKNTNDLSAWRVIGDKLPDSGQK